MAEFLFEIGLEEVPARMLAAAEAELRRRVVELLARERLVAAEMTAESFSTPRRLAVRVRGVCERQQDMAEEMLGPAVKIAYPRGREAEPGPAAAAFARKAGVEVSALKVVETPKGEYVAATATRAGRSAAEVLAEGLPKELAAIYWAKTMYWRAGKPERFVRPVRWLVALLDESVVPVEFGGRTAGRETFGHRVLHGPEPISLPTPEHYAEVLRDAFVEPAVEARRHTIRKALDRVCRGVDGARWREDHALVDKMTHLTEWPSVILGGFDAAYLTLPEEVLVTVMRDHQNYFAVESADGKLAPHFLAVLNTVTDAAGEATIRHGNERVLRARFNDARFFWEFDQRVPLVERVALLEKVTFQKDLGSYAAKSERVEGICNMLGSLLLILGAPIDLKALRTAASLAKADLTSELVKEFTELQGQIGGLYARAEGMPEAVAAAIYDQYRPASMEDAIPKTVEGQILAIADRVDSIAGMFSLGMQPTGSKDPFALRRAANGIVKILAETALPFGLQEVILAAQPSDAVAQSMMSFFTERLEFYLREAKGQAYDVVKAVLSVGGDDVRDAVTRAEAVTAARGGADFAAVSAAFKRMGKIVAQAREKDSQPGASVDPALLTPGAEASLAAEVARVAPSIQVLRERAEYPAALEAIAGIRPQIDAFFDAVMVMDEDPRLRANRLALLDQILTNFSGIADFSEIVVSA